ncbi:type II toxin-antitoxin system HicA family toxin [uncultured Secundilactobacillus sp.]|uniref:type II toxin-antitoxin system HicA family toxin n=1 Tax=uncultured Secundilactobacillus sp. TaxID=2813935 RepID=UPI0025887FBF|nr:type II toxin-antitoxin system HicA family toxin [uncultured Secundilactobacillus sp.]
MPMKTREFVKLLKANGFVHIKGNGGSHQKYFNERTKKTVMVPVHRREIPNGIFQKMLKEAGLK